MVVFGRWPNDAERSRIIEDIRMMLDFHGCHTIGRVRFRTPAEALRLLDNRFSWPDRWMNIERTRAENDIVRPVLMAMDFLGKLMAEGQKNMLQHDLIEGIVWFAGMRIVQRGGDGLSRWRQLEGLPGTEEVKREHARLFASGRM